MTKQVAAGLCLVMLSFTPAIALQSTPGAAPPAAKAPVAKAPAVVKTKPKPVNDEAGIKKMFNDFSQAWAAGDAKKMASFWVKDGSLVNPFGQDAWNRDDVEKILEADTQMMKGSTQAFDDFKFRFILNFALVDCTATVSGLKNADGTDAPSRNFHIYAAAAMRDDKWYLLALRPYEFAQLPGAIAATAAANPAAASMSATPAPAAAPAATPASTPAVNK